MPDRLHFTGNDEADALLAQEPMALLIGFARARVQDLGAFVAERYGGRAERLWTEASDADDLRARIAELPGFGEMKIKALGSVLAKRFGVAAAQGLVPSHPTLGDVDSAEALQSYQEAKRAYKKALKQG